MAKINYTGPTLASPVWAGDFLDRNALVPGGAKLNPAGFAANAAGKKPVPSGTALGRTLAERNAGTGFGPADAADDEIFLLALDVTDALVNNDCELYRPGRIVKENFLPGFGGLAAGVITALRDLYVMTRGAE
jgi:hypothetical protein